MEQQNGGKEFSVDDMPSSVEGFFLTEYHIGTYTYLYAKEHEYLFYDELTQKVIYRGTTTKDVVIH